MGRRKAGRREATSAQLASDSECMKLRVDIGKLDLPIDERAVRSRRVDRYVVSSCQAVRVLTWLYPSSWVLPDTTCHRFAALQLTILLSALTIVFASLTVQSLVVLKKISVSPASAKLAMGSALASLLC